MNKDFLIKQFIINHYYSLYKRFNRYARIYVCGDCFNQKI